MEFLRKFANNIIGGIGMIFIMGLILFLGSAPIAMALKIGPIGLLLYIPLIIFLITLMN